VAEPELAGSLVPGLLPAVAELGLVDHHCHGVVGRDLDRPAFELMLTEADYVGRPGVTMFGSQLGLALRRWCPPVLGLPAHTGPEEYLEVRAGLGWKEVSRRFLRAAGLGALYVDTGFEPEPLTTPAELGALAGAPSREVVRLEQVAEAVAAGLAGQAGAAAGFGPAFQAALAERGRDAAGFKSVAAYRVGLDLAPGRPTGTEVAVAAAHWLDTPSGRPGRLADPVLHRFFIWCAADLGRPIQFHVGYGDRDVDLHRCNPLLLTGLLRALEPAGVPVMLLHNYPFHREAGYLAQVFPQVYVDAGLATHNLGRGSAALIAEALELTPFGKFLYSSDGFGLPELHYLGAVLFRRGLSRFLRDGLDDGDWTEADTEQIARQAGYENAERVYAN
jgi:uncharacterized protein